MSRWIVVSTTYESGGITATNYMVTDTLGMELAFHPIRSTHAEAAALCDALNRIGWGEDDYFDRGQGLDAAVERGTVDEFIAAEKYGRPSGGVVGTIVSRIREAVHM